MKKPRSGPRMVVSYIGGGWTEHLAVDGYNLDVGQDGLTLVIDVAPRERAGKVRAAREALQSFIAKRRRIETIQIPRRSITREIREATRKNESARLSVKLRANGHAVLYPAEIAFGPDAMTLSLG